MGLVGGSSKMKVGALIRCYGLTKYLPVVLRSFEWVDKVLVMNNRFKGVKVREDNTPEICSKFKNVVCKTGEGLDQHDAFNVGLKEFEGFDYVFISDADELIARKDQDFIIASIKDHDAVKCKVIDYARSLDLIFPIRGHEPIVLVKPTTQFYDVRCARGRMLGLPQLFIHHFGYVYPVEDMAWKIDWEKPWEHSSVIDLLARLPICYEMPEEIKEMLNA